ncbi:MAG: NifU family protein [candidate division WOR-3 bacterium]|nr:NifU family protein [candidate division WOR-3 bacterium]
MDEAKIKGVIAKIKPALQRDGGDIQFVSFDGETVKVRLTGACVGCPMAGITIKNTVERMIKQEIPQVKKVLAV